MSAHTLRTDGEQNRGLLLHQVRQQQTFPWIFKIQKYWTEVVGSFVTQQLGNITKEKHGPMRAYLAPSRGQGWKLVETEKNHWPPKK